MTSGRPARTGNQFQTSIVDLWSHHAPYPTNRLPKRCSPAPKRLPARATHASFLRSYNFLVKHAWLWRLNFEWSSFKLVHNSMFAVRSHPRLVSNARRPARLLTPCPDTQAYGAVVSRMFSKAFDTYAPDLVVSVHPLMQHIPVRPCARALFAALCSHAPP